MVYMIMIKSQVTKDLESHIQIIIGVAGGFAAVCAGESRRGPAARSVRR